MDQEPDWTPRRAFLLMIRFPNNPEFLRQTKNAQPATNVISLTIRDAEGQAREAS